jgi:hypothetical protein
MRCASNRYRSFIVVIGNGGIWMDTDGQVYVAGVDQNDHG